MFLLRNRSPRASTTALTPSSWLPCALVLALLSACSSTPQNKPEIPAGNRDEVAGYEVITRDHIYESELPLTEVRIVNHHGDLRVRSGSRNALGLVSVVQKLAPEWLEPEFVVRNSAGRIELEIRYAESAPGAEKRFGRPGRVDLVALIPATVPVDVETTDGALVIRRRGGPVRARTESGAIQVSTLGSLDVASQSGDILARFQSAIPTGNWQVRSHSGTVNMLLPRDGNYVLQARAGGTVRADVGWYPADAMSIPPGAQSFERQFGAGGPLCVVESTTGDINIAALSKRESEADED